MQALHQFFILFFKNKMKAQVRLHQNFLAKTGSWGGEIHTENGGGAGGGGGGGGFRIGAGKRFNAGKDAPLSSPLIDDIEYMIYI
jgi:hypothetical protein